MEPTDNFNQKQAMALAQRALPAVAKWLGSKVLRMRAAAPASTVVAGGAGSRAAATAAGLTVPRLPGAAVQAAPAPVMRAARTLPNYPPLRTGPIPSRPAGAAVQAAPAPSTTAAMPPPLPVAAATAAKGGGGGALGKAVGFGALWSAPMLVQNYVQAAKDYTGWQDIQSAGVEASARTMAEMADIYDKLPWLQRMGLAWSGANGLWNDKTKTLIADHMRQQDQRMSKLLPDWMNRVESYMAAKKKGLPSQPWQLFNPTGSGMVDERVRQLNQGTAAMHALLNQPDKQPQVQQLIQAINGMSAAPAS